MDLAGSARWRTSAPSVSGHRVRWSTAAANVYPDIIHAEGWDAAIRFTERFVTDEMASDSPKHVASSAQSIRAE